MYRRTMPMMLGSLLALSAPAARADDAADAGPPPIAAVPPAPPAPPAPRESVRFLGEDDKHWGVEIDAIRPILAGQYQAKGTYTAWRKGGFAGELVLGAATLFGRENDDGKLTEVQGIFGYRQFVWRGLHADITVLPGYASHRSKIDGQNRSGFVASTELVAGYRWDIAFERATLYLLTDAGVGLIFANTDRWPETSASMFRHQEPYFAGNIALGVRF